MKATINLEFTDQELTGFVERWANKVAVSAFSDMAAQIGPLMPLIREAFMRTVAAETAQGHAPPPSPFPTEGGPAPTRDGCEEELRTHCIPVSTPNVMPGWVCHECRAYNGLQRTQCKACGHTRCGPAFPQPPPSSNPHVPYSRGNALAVFHYILSKSHPADKTVIRIHRVSDERPVRVVEIVSRDGADLLEAIRELHGLRGETVYEVEFLDKSSGERLGDGQITMPDARPMAGGSVPAPPPESGG